MYWLEDNQISLGHSRAKIVEEAQSYFKCNQIITPKTLKHDVYAAINEYEENFLKETYNKLSNRSKDKMILLEDKKLSNNESVFNYLKKDTGSVSLETILENTNKLRLLTSIYRKDILREYEILEIINI